MRALIHLTLFAGLFSAVSCQTEDVPALSEPDPVGNLETSVEEMLDDTAAAMDQVELNELDRLKTATRGAARSNLAVLKSALDQYAIENGGRYPDSLESLITPDENGRAYLDRRTLPLDPWKAEYQYEPPQYSATGDVVLFSMGADQMPGGDDDNADIHWNDD